MVKKKKRVNSSRSQVYATMKGTNQILIRDRVAGAKRGKTLAIKSVIVLGSVLIGWENGVRFFSQLQSLTLSNQITFNFHLKIVLESNPGVVVNHNMRGLPCKPNRTWFFLQTWKAWSWCYKLRETCTASIFLEVTGVAHFFCHYAHTVTKNSTDIREKADCK